MQMGRVVAIKVPAWAIPDGAVLSTKDAIAGAAELRMSPLFEGLDGAGRIERIRLDQGSDAYLSHLERVHEGVPKGRICAGLIAAYYRQPGAKASTGDRLHEFAEGLGFRARVAQEQLYKELRETLAQGKIGMHEASTGTGKTLAILAAAVDAAVAGERVVIAVPTLGLVEVINGDLEKLSRVVIDLPSWQPIYGRSEFVSRAAAELRLTEEPSDGLRDMLAMARETGDWRLASWQRQSPGLTGLSTCAVSSMTSKDDPGLLAYRAQFTDAPADILVCTHAMLAIDTVLRRMRIGNDAEFKEQRKIRKDTDGSDYRIENQLRAAFEKEEHRHLPEYGVAFVDEAHLLEQAFASVMAVDVSLWHLVRALRALKDLNQNAVPGDALKAVQRAFDRLRRGEDTDTRMIGNDAKEASELRKVSEALTIVKETRKGCEKDPQAQEFVGRARESLRAFLSDRLALAMLSYSPSKRFPRLLMGRKTSHREMHYLWSSMRAGALVSATLNTTTGAGEASTASARYLLNVPIDRVRSTPPIINSEIYRPVTCFTPNVTLARSGWLVRPSTGEEADEQEWFTALANPISRIGHGAVGGTLVLTTSYRAIDALRERLIDSLGGRLIFSEPGKRTVQIADEFLDRSAAGERPVWLATGAAWTGLDLSGVRRGLAAKDDNILTDLVITNIPFRTNRSLTHASRTMRGGNFEFFDTFVKFKQGLGRLVRNPSSDLPPNRRIWIMDGRLYDLRSKGRLAPFAALLRAYRQQHFG